MLPLSKIDEARLAAVVDAAVATGLAHSIVLGRRPNDEPEAVLAVFSNLVTAQPAWTAILAPLGLRVEMHGAFIHGTPQVTFHPHKTPNDRCELGDLMIVIDDRRHGHDDRRALIIQAKLASGPSLSLTSPGDLKQLDLNMNWPPFEFVPSAYSIPPHPSPWDFRDRNAPGHVHESSAYGAVDLAGRTWEQHVPSTPMTMGTGESLGVTAGKMLVGVGGRKAEIPSASGATCADDWSETVERVLRKSASAITSKRLGGTARAWSLWVDTGPASGFVVAEDYARHVIGRYLPPPDSTEEDDGDGGMSTFHVVISSADDRPDRGTGTLRD
ncbi:hypothetical protein [Brevundimonas nasdae]|uniref:Uncharacterized protein n=1 Tax=Brevundimonas nasdae TaxID=172043 RepID=A0ABX8TJP1_9CAUL|nr:hypothetical protein [Brevundimonas nasdae]QYC11441.1 hypothetical protein KWG56_05555 [Brevundimonas nasdae]QYC14229.1 hypothetical protein KWG63_00890 [Brevundimonas nasdae]